MRTYVSVCKNIILSNLKHGLHKPPIRVSKGLYGRPRIVYSPNKPAPWGARVWIELDQ